MTESPPEPDGSEDAPARTAPPPSRRQQLRARIRQMSRAVSRRVPVGLRLPVGLLLIVGGTLGFLPVLGFWMIPLGVIVASLDYRALVIWHKRRKRSK